MFLAGTGSATAAPTVPFQRSVTVGEWGPSAYKPAATKAALERLRHRHVDTVTLFVVWEQDGPASTNIGPGGRTVRIANLVAAIRAARSLGMNVVLRPYIDRADGGWRGQLEPTSLDTWFASYKRFVVRFARLARREHVEGLVVGSEMVSLSDEAARWRSLVRALRKSFKGFLSYEANWDEAESVTWWRSLDAISISAYYPLTVKVDYTTADLVRGWRAYQTPEHPAIDWFKRIEALHARYARPVIFGEIGYRTIVGAATKPWDTALPGARQLQAQKRAYAAAFRVWYRVPWFRGFHWWYVPPQQSLVVGFPGADHRIAKPTLRLIGSWYARKRSG